MADLNGRIGVRIHRCRTYLRKWFPGTPVWIWSALFIVVIFTSNVLSVRFFAETEFWFSFIKVAALGPVILTKKMTVARCSACCRFKGMTMRRYSRTS